jgi:hypothetical protein
VVIAVVTVWVVQVAIYKIIHVVSVGNRFVTAIGAMNMPVLMPCHGLTFGAAIGILVVNLDSVLVDMIAVWMMEMPIV